MIKKTVTLNLPEGEFEAKVLEFEESDRQVLSNVYRNWRALCSDLSKLEGRCVNVPEVLSEGVFCLEMRAVRIKSRIQGANTSFDCYSLQTGERIQVKACSVIPDLTSFGPKSTWDKLYFLDFYRQGRWDGTFDIYLIDNQDVYNYKVNKSETFKQQQNQKRRPRFSIYKGIIQLKGLTPIKTAKLW